jgi:tetratricopeptide (TPR) repeat protein
MCRYNANSGDCAEAVEAADELVRRHLHTESVAETVVSALSMKASCLGPDKLNQPEEQLETLELMLNRFGTSKSDRIQSGVALANFTRAALLETRGGWREAVSIWADLFEQLRWHPPTKARWVPFRSQTARVDTLLRAQEADEALSAGLALIEQLGDAEPGEGLSDLAKAAFNIALAFERAGRLTEASRFFQVTAERLSGSDDADLTSLGILARVNAIQTLGRLGDIDGAMQEALAIVSAGEPAIAVTSKIIEEARRDGTKLEREREPWALLVQALVLAKLGRERQARDRLTEIINEFSNDDSPVAAQLVGAARYALIKLPGQQPS